MRQQLKWLLVAGGPPMLFLVGLLSVLLRDPDAAMQIVPAVPFLVIGVVVWIWKHS